MSDYISQIVAAVHICPALSGKVGAYIEEDDCHHCGHTTEYERAPFPVKHLPIRSAMDKYMARTLSRFIDLELKRPMVDIFSVGNQQEGRPLKWETFK